jgi:hypothetical protein
MSAGIPAMGTDVEATWYADFNADGNYETFSV